MGFIYTVLYCIIDNVMGFIYTGQIFFLLILTNQFGTNTGAAVHTLFCWNLLILQPEKALFFSRSFSNAIRRPNSMFGICCFIWNDIITNNIAHVLNQPNSSTFTRYWTHKYYLLPQGFNRTLQIWKTLANISIWYFFNILHKMPSARLTDSKQKISDSQTEFSNMSRFQWRVLIGTVNVWKQYGIQGVLDHACKVMYHVHMPTDSVLNNHHLLLILLQLLQVREWWQKVDSCLVYLDS